MLGHFIFMRVGHLNVVAKYLIVPDFQRGNTRLFRKLVFDAGNILFPISGNFPKLIQVVIKPVVENTAVTNAGRRIFFDRLFNAVLQIHHQFHPVTDR